MKRLFYILLIGWWFGPMAILLLCPMLSLLHSVVMGDSFLYVFFNFERLAIRTITFGLPDDDKWICEHLRGNK